MPEADLFLLFVRPLNRGSIRYAVTEKHLRDIRSMLAISGEQLFLELALRSAAPLKNLFAAAAKEPNTVSCHAKPTESAAILKSHFGSDFHRPFPAPLSHGCVCPKRPQ